MNKLTDAEIVKSLESLLDKMRAYESLQASIGKGLVEDIISMYNRQKAEIEEQHKKIEFLQASKGLNQAEFAEVKAELELKKAEIERLNIRNKALTAITKNYDWKFAKAKAEAIKEFWKRLKNRRKVYYKPCVGKPYREEFIYIEIEDGDNLLKEMVGEPQKINHNSLCETETYKVDGSDGK